MSIHTGSLLLESLKADVTPILSKEEQTKKDRRRAEVYAVNAYLKQIEQDNFEHFKATANVGLVKGLRSDDNNSCCSEESSICLYENKLLQNASVQRVAMKSQSSGLHTVGSMTNNPMTKRLPMTAPSEPQSGRRGSVAATPNTTRRSSHVILGGV